jgi:hypothetical protein
VYSELLKSSLNKQSINRMCCERAVRQKYRPVLHQSSGGSFSHGRAVLWIVFALKAWKIIC